MNNIAENAIHLKFCMCKYIYTYRENTNTFTYYHIYNIQYFKTQQNKKSPPFPAQYPGHEKQGHTGSRMRDTIALTATSATTAATATSATTATTAGGTDIPDQRIQTLSG